MKTATMPHVHIKLISSCLWCEKEIPFKQNIKGKLLCSMKCLKAINNKIKDPNFFYGKEEVVKTYPSQPPK